MPNISKSLLFQTLLITSSSFKVLETGKVTGQQYTTVIPHNKSSINLWKAMVMALSSELMIDDHALAKAAKSRIQATKYAKEKRKGRNSSLAP